jgi:hypothetical protein
MNRVLLLASAFLLSGCRPCTLHSHKACIAYADGAQPPEDAQARWDAALESAADFWGEDVSRWRGWTVTVHGPETGTDVHCWWRETTGCTNPLLGDVHLREARGCGSTWLWHEAGHVFAHYRHGSRFLAADYAGIDACRWGGAP